MTTSPSPARNGTHAHRLQIPAQPHNLEAEQAVLGSILIDPDQLYHLPPGLHPDDFFLVKHQWIWSALLALAEHKAPIDLLTASEELERRDQLDQVGGPAYLAHLLNVVPTAIHAQGYARIVQHASRRRMLIQAASRVAQLAYQQDSDLDQVIDQAQAAILSACAEHQARPLQALPALLPDYFHLVEARHDQRDGLLGVPTGFLDLDRLLGGLHPADLVVLAARPGVGKTSLLLNIALNVVLRFHRRVALLSLEMSRRQLVERLVAQRAAIDSQRLRSGRLDDQDWAVFLDTINLLDTNGQGLWIDDSPALSIAQAQARLRQLKAQHGLDLVILDYLQLLSPGRPFNNRVQEVSYLSRALKTLAGELAIPVLVASQMSRAIELRLDKRPILSDLRESGSIEQDADVVLFLHRNDQLDPDRPPFELIVAKQRNGPTGALPLIFRKHLTLFVSAEKREVQL